MPRDPGHEKRRKHFVEDKSEALRLAEVIGGAQEEKAQIKAEKRRQKPPPIWRQESRPNRTRRVQVSAAKVKLKETKALVAARQAQIKKHKAKQRKQAKDGVLSELAPPTMPPTRKKVSFALSVVPILLSS
ncbi:hypothetical protein BDN71DRAFT_991421 [Pleurotus eryngii]|uniref:Uncharacterized protein n=1 Tax=Pleurotus eryngii TaxID=5323 RepID=A0A9P6D6B1_PLEER|nr:hypothetical protein BDN71DRAFT_991421 [Pleurotus eryngii]